MGGKRPKLLEAERAWLMQRVAERPDLTLVALLVELRAKDNGKGKRVCLDTLWRFLKGCGLSFKKTIHAAEQDRPDVARRRYWWRKYQTRIEPSRLVFIDETWIKTNMTRLRG